MVVQENEEENRGGGSAITLMGPTVKLSINSIVGLTTLDMMKIKEEIRPKEVIVLIDNRASHNFIAVDVVRQLGLPLSSTIGYGMIMGTGLTVKGEGVCKGVKL